MIPILNEKYNYIMLYVPKAACSVMRKTYIDFHIEEFTDEQQAVMRDNNKMFHGLANIHSGNRMPPESFYGMFKFIVTRNPYERALSAYYDKFLYLRNNNTWKTTKLNNLFNIFELTKDLQLLKKLTLLDDLHKCNLVFNEYAKVINFTDKVNIAEIDNSFTKYLEFILLCKTHNIKAYDEHHDLQSIISNKFNIDKVHENIKVVQIENFKNNLIKCVSDIFKGEDLLRYTRIFEQNSQDPRARNSNFKQVEEKMNGAVLNRTYFIERISSKQTILNTNTMVDQKCENLVHTIYEQDFNLYNYTRKTTKG